MAKNNFDTQEIIDKIFRDPTLPYGLKEFEALKPSEILNIYEKEKGKFYLKCFKRDKDVLVWNEDKQVGRPEEIIRQLWLYKLIKSYGYPKDRIDVETDIRFGREIHAKAADIMVYREDKETPWIIIEVKNPKEKEALGQLKSYLNAEGSPIGVWSNGIEKAILYRPYPQMFERTLRDIPRVDQTIEDVLEEKLTLGKLKTDYNLVEIIKILEELVLANAGVDVFQEVFKLIYAKLWDEKEAKTRPDQEVYFRQSKDSQFTYDTISRLFQNAIKEWPGMFSPHDKIELSPDHLSVCVGQLEQIRFLDANLETVDAAFEYLLPEIAKAKKGQYFTPRHVIDMAVKMLNPKEDEYVIDPAAGSGGFLIHAMQYVWKNIDSKMREKEVWSEKIKNAIHEKQIHYAQRYLYGIDFDDKPVKISRAMMLIAGDGRAHIFKLNSLNSKEWFSEEPEKVRARAELQERLYRFEDYDKNKDNQSNFTYFDFDVLLTNPPFAGEIREPSLLKNYELARDKKGKLKNKMERHILFIERALNFIKPGGRLAIVLPQGVLNNTNLEYVREWILNKARILAVVGLHGNTFKPHTGTKTSVLFLQKWAEGERPLKDYPIFMAISKKPGKDSSGDYIYKKDERGNFRVDFRGRKILDHDLDEIAEEFIKFAKQQGFSFWK